MKRKGLYILLLLLIGATAFVLYRKHFKKTPSFPNANVLLITIDTIRPDRLSCYGSSNQTPNIDAIAREGLLFENAFCQVPLTFPSHTSILTGLFPLRHGVHQNGLELFDKPI
ncbi:MAG TPA: sulfatase-like hydrolase/transferase, partial [Acidobacteriota bacterium]